MGKNAGQLAVNAKAALGTQVGVTAWSVASACESCSGAGKKGMFGPAGFGMLASTCEICGGSGQASWPEETLVLGHVSEAWPSAAAFGSGLSKDMDAVDDDVPQGRPSASVVTKGSGLSSDRGRGSGESVDSQCERGFQHRGEVA